MKVHPVAKIKKKKEKKRNEYQYSTTIKVYLVWTHNLRSAHQYKK